jgi:hypothetical protein
VVEKRQRGRPYLSDGLELSGPAFIPTWWVEIFTNLVGGDIHDVLLFWRRIDCGGDNFFPPSGILSITDRKKKIKI